MLEAQEDEELMRAYQSGNPRAFRELLKRHQGGVYRFCLRSMGDKEAATDATQEIFLRVVKNAMKWEKKAKFTTWLYTIARNYCIDQARRGRVRRTESLNRKLSKEGDGAAERIDQIEGKELPADQQSENIRLRAAIDQALGKLSIEQRQVFTLRQYAGLSFREIGQIAEVSENTIKSRMRYALNSLREELKQAGFTP